jgi:hypothetical protein
MPQFLIRRVFEFVPGTVNGAPEAVPADLRDDKGQLIQPLAWWPAQPFAIESGEEKSALHWAERQWVREKLAVCLDNRVTQERFVELQARRRPGAPDDSYNSVRNYWAVQVDGGLWHSA